MVGNRTIHVFRATLGAFTPSDRADAARQRIDRAFDEGGEGWTSVKASDSGVLIELDGKPMFTVAPGDARLAAGETTADLPTRHRACCRRRGVNRVSGVTRAPCGRPPVAQRWRPPFWSLRCC